MRGRIKVYYYLFSVIYHYLVHTFTLCLPLSQAVFFLSFPVLPHPSTSFLHSVFYKKLTWMWQHFWGGHWAANKKLKISCEGPYVVNAFTRWLPLLRLSSVTHSLSFLIPPPAPLSCTLFSIETFTYFSHPYLALCYL